MLKEHQSRQSVRKEQQGNLQILLLCYNLKQNYGYTKIWA